MRSRVICLLSTLILLGFLPALINGPNGSVAQAQNFTISGRVTDTPPGNVGTGIEGVTMTLALGGSTQVILTNPNGEYSFSVPAESDFTLTPSKPGFVFHPVSHEGTNLNENITRFFTGTGFHFSAQNYDVHENAGSVTVTVVRTGGDQTVAATVSYQTEDDPAAVPCSQIGTTAYARCDYATTVGTLTFEPGQTSKIFSIPIIDDSYNENNETFTVRVKGTLTAPDTSTITIIDNDATDGANPIFTTPFFVRLHYLDFLSREPEPGEPWSAVLNNCSDVNNDPTCDRLTVSAAFFGSPEFQLKGYFVYRFYKLAFNRLPTYAEISFDMAAVTGQTAAEVFARKAAFTNAFVLRQEFIDAFDALNNTQYVEALMGRYNLAQITTPDPANPDGDQKVTRTTAELITALNGATLTRAQVLRMIADSDQVFSLEFNQAFVAMQYFGYLRRAPEQAGFDAWLLYLNANPTDFRTMVNGFMNSIEYRLRFGPP